MSARLPQLPAPPGQTLITAHSLWPVVLLCGDFHPARGGYSQFSLEPILKIAGRAPMPGFRRRAPIPLQVAMYRGVGAASADF